MARSTPLDRVRIVPWMSAWNLSTLTLEPFEAFGVNRYVAPSVAAAVEAARSFAALSGSHWIATLSSPSFYTYLVRARLAKWSALPFLSHQTVREAPCVLSTALRMGTVCSSFLVAPNM